MMMMINCPLVIYSRRGFLVRTPICLYDIAKKCTMDNLFLLHQLICFPCILASCINGKRKKEVPPFFLVKKICWLFTLSANLSTFSINLLYLDMTLSLLFFSCQIKSNVSLYLLYYAETCNEFAGPISATLHPGNTAPFEKML